MNRIVSVLALVFLFIPATSQAQSVWDRNELLLARGFIASKDGLTVRNLFNPHLNFYRDFPAQNADGTTNLVVEIPAGDNRKFEVSEQTGVMSWEIKNGKPRLINFLGYPANYGMVPRTMGGDGDSLDGITLGKFEFRGEVTQVKVIGVLHLIDGGDVDDKIIAVIPGTVFGDIDSLAELDARYPSIKAIIETWFEDYKGPGELHSLGFGDADEAQAVIDAAKAAYVP